MAILAPLYGLAKNIQISLFICSSVHIVQVVHIVHVVHGVHIL
jgi:hypothetical protein